MNLEQVNKLIDFNTYKVNWKKIEKIPEFAVLATCKQNPTWHAEGDALKHTKRVVEAAQEIINRKDIPLSSLAKALLITSALFHDIGKGVTTEFKKGNWHAYNHEFEGERITRTLLWDCPIWWREEVCALVRWHMEPLRVFDGKEHLEKIVRLSKRVYVDILLYLKEADLMGSDQVQDKTNDFAKLQMIRNITLDMGCYNVKGIIPVDGEYPWLKQEPKHKVFMLIGLPGSGKDTYINTMREKDDEWKNAVVLCRDDIRVELGLCEEGEKIVAKAHDEDRVSKIFNDRLIEAAKEGKNIIINNINLKKKYRDDYHQRIAQYPYSWEYVYIEADSLNKNIERREHQIIPDVFNNIIMGIDWPDYTEYDKLTIETN